MFEQLHKIIHNGVGRSAARRSSSEVTMRTRKPISAERFRERAGGSCDVEIVPDCNHFYVGRETAICEIVAGWLARTLNIGAAVSH